ncbi:D-lactate dehydrogenase [Zymomonas mobilis]|uniref:Quinone-dependent D-lactate dehydrogenase n=1 Tax=Zymomonas mobilis subsp. pomaceae (strain ATCC 29192 / DSM 22645 / JCM 10191 / CCUG 17912 / NBRC 13757 / NCIMB 11200 / NRRL B-4491 / Barker I) TaxID=579138 RepID=F8ESP0_ZYMMT|nr:D-lactate dehydrogenase [Zymomonas mobilis]AEI37815.1 D-lactate dehydrogenase [Zymomonas mobilis subsp. pomaceae ATCC 29192]MDX5949182.1 D-lactate dehydrogenase [Zymomonas mobilis subsp. pomaceae]GEB89818.1 D-lactate dehydrogenase [Zymomonas mobilis subsp. pomaceae]
MVQLPSSVGHGNEAENQQFLSRLHTIVGHSHVLTSAEKMHHYCKGFRFGMGKLLAVVRPSSLVEMWKVVAACVEAGKIIIMQAANTGLTGGSTPDGDDYDRDIVLISGLRLTGIKPINNGHQVICLPGATLYELENVLRPLGREPHSVIGSSCIGASVFGGVCNNSGGALVQRGPAFTQLTLYARINEQGTLELVNHLGIRLGDDPETILSRVEKGQYTQADIINDDSKSASDHDYQHHVREIEAETPARFNADSTRLYESSGSAGKIALFAVRLDTFPQQKDAKVFYIGTNDPDEFTELRRHILKDFQCLPIAGEYLHRHAYDIAAQYGKDTFLAIEYLGTDRLPKLFALKSWMDGLNDRVSHLIPRHLSDHLMQFSSTLFPHHLPKRMDEFRDRYEHHLILKISADGISEARNFLESFFKKATGSYFECTAEEGKKAFLHRFAAAGAAIRYRDVHPEEVEDIVALDIALPRNNKAWQEHLPPEITKKISHILYYGHFFCQVFHQDYIIKKGENCSEIEHQMWKILDKRHAEYPAEHNVGHLYYAKDSLKQHYHTLDPTNYFNPGIGHTSKAAYWK